jgi:hypothetical protein
MHAAEDARLLAALFATWPNRPFDASSISGEAPHDTRLLAALAPLGACVRKSGLIARLRLADTERIRRWFDEIEGVERGGLVLTRDKFGWCRVGFAGGVAKPDAEIWGRGRV